MFHHAVANLLFMITRYRKDIHTVVSFLKTWLKQLDEYEWVKLRRVLNYLKSKKYMKHNFRVDSARDAIMILEEGNRPHPRFPDYDIFFPRVALNRRHPTTALCKSG